MITQKIAPNQFDAFECEIKLWWLKVSKLNLIFFIFLKYLESLIGNIIVKDVPIYLKCVINL